MTQSEPKPKPQPPSPTQNSDKKKNGTLKPMPASIRIDLFGDLLKFTKKSQQTLSFRKFDQLALFLAQKPRDERLLIYKIFCGLSLTAHARRTQDGADRKRIFDLKNQIFLSIANDPSLRRLVNLRLGVSKRFKVIEYCPTCSEKNRAENLNPRDWKFCQKCRIDRNYYNIISLQHRFDDGSGALFLGQEHMKELQFHKVLKKIPLTKIEEELSFSKYKFNPKTLISIELESLKTSALKLLDLAKKPTGPVAAPKQPGPVPIKR
jgi:hypothetical protein